MEMGILPGFTVSAPTRPAASAVTVTVTFWLTASGAVVDKVTVTSLAKVPGTETLYVLTGPPVAVNWNVPTHC